MPPSSLSQPYVSYPNFSVSFDFSLVGTNLSQLYHEICRTILSLPYHDRPPPIPPSPSALPKGQKGGAFPLPQYIGVGTILNIWSNSTEGQMIHLVVTGGEVQTGTWFSAGGWAGKLLY